MSTTFFVISLLFFSTFWSTLNYHIRNVGIFIYLLQSFSYFMTATINPGIPKQYFTDISNPVSFGSIENTQELKACAKCNIQITPNSYTYHCDQCRICIEGKYR